MIKDKDEEKKKLEEEEQEFLMKRRDRGRKIIQIEKEELGRRESEVFYPQIKSLDQFFIFDKTLRLDIFTSGERPASRVQQTEEDQRGGGGQAAGSDQGTADGAGGEEV